MNSTSNPFSWKMSPQELEFQVANYRTLSFSKSARGIVIQIMGIIIILSLVLASVISSIMPGFFSMTGTIIESIVYAVLLIFVYMGHRWAMVTVLVLWTLDKASTAYLQLSHNGNAFMSILFWLIIAPYIIKAIKVENARRKAGTSSNISNSTSTKA